MTSTVPVRAVVFDLDGLMFNTELVFNLTGTELMRRRGKVATKELFQAMMGRRAPEAFQAMIDLMELTESIDELSVESSEIFEGLLVDRLAPMPGLYDLLDLLETRGLPKAVATSSDRVYATRILGQFEILDRFCQIMTGDDVTHGKPHPEIYTRSAEGLKLSPQEILVLEDSENGTRAAAAAGARVISVPHDHSSHHDFSSAVAVAKGLNDPVIRKVLDS